MFADSLFHSSYSASPRRAWTTLLSFGAQAALAAALFVLPLLWTENLPALHFTSELLLPLAPPPHVEPPATRPSPTHGEFTQTQNVWMMPRHIPSITRNDPGPVVPPTIAPGVPNQNPNGPAGPISDVMNAFPTVAHPALAHLPRLSLMMEGNLIRRIQPIYPAAAKLTGMEGAVVLQAVISREGKIEDLAIVEGNPILARAAVTAVKQWLYRPYRLNNEPVEVQTQITVNFVLSR